MVPLYKPASYLENFWKVSSAVVRAANTAHMQLARSSWGYGCRVPHAEAGGFPMTVSYVLNAVPVHCGIWSNRHCTGRGAQHSETTDIAYSESAGTG